MCVEFSTPSKRTVYFQIVPVRIEGFKGAGPVDTYAILDTGSSDTLLREEIANKLCLDGPEHRLTLGNVDNDGSKRISRLINIKVTPTGKGAVNKTVSIEHVWTVPRLNIPPRQLVKEKDRQRWTHLNDLDIPAVSTNQVGLLIGVDVSEAMLQHEYKRGPKGQPYAVRTDFGWAVAGAVRGTLDMNTRQAHVGHANVVMDEKLNNQLEQWWKTESFGTKYARHELRSVEDERALQNLQTNTKFREDLGHYETVLLWKAGSIALPNNLEPAKRRLAQLERNLDKDPNKASLYYTTMNSYIEKGYARKLTETEANSQPKNTWYLPHHAVTNPNKPGKLRVVFDAAAEHKGTSLNDNQVTGPDLLNSLVGVIMRFRLHAFAFTADIESMFFQVRVIERDQPSLRFLWRGENRDQPPDAYQMQVLIFGAKCSPCCASYCLRLTATDGQESYDLSTLNTILHDFYMDDVLKSVKTETEAIRLSQQLIDILSRRGFRLTKFLSNSRRVLENLPTDEVSRSVTNLDLEDLPVERALGVLWNTENDTLEIKVSQEKLIPTKRNILRKICTVFDPLGFASPFVLRAKIIMQHLWRQSYDWDQPISGQILQAWELWNEELTKLADFTLPRCYVDTTKEVDGVQLHIFADASEDAFGAVAYTRYEYTDNTFSCSFVFSKARLAPVKPLTIPRLELQATVLAVRMGQMLSKELGISKDQITYWTDSMTVLQYINNIKTRFHTFVSNRVAEIRESSSPRNWRHVPGRLNSADDCSRGLAVEDLLDVNSRWVCGPNFLKQSEIYWPEQKAVVAPQESDPEVKSDIWCAFSFSQDEQFIKPEDFSSLLRLLRVTGWIQRFANNCRAAKQHAGITGPLSVEEIENAERLWVRRAQTQAYSDEMTKLRSGQEISPSSSLKSLNPVLDEEDILRVGGRIKHAPIPYNAKHPIILPRSHSIVKLIVSSIHEHLNHSGVEHVISELRQKYWIPQVRAIAKKIAKSCPTCKRSYSQPVPPMMANLPPSRLQPFSPPFCNTGVDYFGPMLVKQGRSKVKRYGCLFTCMVTRSVHLEIAHALDTDSFIMALRRMIARRGKPRHLYSDNGTNFVGAERELKECLESLDQGKIANVLTQERIQWHFNPPSSPHFGGVWERLVQSAKKALKVTLNGQLVNDEVLHTLMVEVESLLNSRPLTHVSVDPQDPEPITPNHFLIGRSSPNIPPGTFDDQDLYGRKRWRQAQILVDLYWKRWLREYVPNLTERRKWNTPTARPLKADDVVLVVDENLPRGQWRLGRVIKTFSGEDGQVRSAEVKTKYGQYKRPAVKLCLLQTH
jgi:hypothetical protein